MPLSGASSSTTASDTDGAGAMKPLGADRAFWLFALAACPVLGLVVAFGGVLAGVDNFTAYLGLVLGLPAVAAFAIGTRLARPRRERVAGAFFAVVVTVGALFAWVLVALQFSSD